MLGIEMNLLHRYRRLTFWNKLFVWATLCSIVTLPLAFNPSSPKEGQKIVVKDSPNSLVQAPINSPNSVQIAAGQVTINQSHNRSITPEAKDRMVGILRRFAGAKANMVYEMGDAESYSFAKKVSDVFETAGWQVSGWDQAHSAQPIPNLVVRVSSDKPTEKYLAVFAAFKVLGLKAPFAVMDYVKPDEIEIRIGQRIE